MKVLKNNLFWFKNFFLDLFFPTRCIKCQTFGPELCKTCSTSMKYPDQENMDNIFACFQYQDPIIKKLLHSLKYYRKQTIGNTLGEYIYDRLIEEIAELQLFSSGSPIMLVPIPLSSKRLQKRGYNQATLIAKGMIHNDKDHIFVLEKDLVVKIKDTLPQAKIKNRATRLRNIVGCFAIKHPHKIRGRTVIVVDDVTTTGGTISEIMKLLKKSGAKKVVGFAVAH